MTPAQKKLLLILMVAVMVVLNADGNVMAPTLPRIEAEFGVSDADIGGMMGLFTLVGALVSLVWGYLADKASRKLLFVVSVAIGELPCLFSAFAPNYQVFFALRMLTGIGVGAAYPLVFSILGDIYDEKERPLTTAVLAMAFGLGNIVGAVVGGYLGDSLGWRIPFIIVAAPNLPLLLAFWFLVPEPRAAASEAATKELVEAGILYPKKIRLADYAGLLKVRTNVALFIQGIAGTIPWGAFFFLNKFLESGKGLSTAQATTVYLVFGVGMVAGTLLGGKLGGIAFGRSRRALPLFCAVTTFLGATATEAVVYLDVPVAILSLLGFSAAALAAMTGPNMKTMLLDVNVPESRGPIFSIFNLTDSLGTGLGRWVAGLLSLAVGLSGSIALCAAFWVLCAAVLWAAAFVFPADVDVLHRRMEDAAASMRSAREAKA